MEQLASLPIAYTHLDVTFGNKYELIVRVIDSIISQQLNPNNSLV